MDEAERDQEVLLGDLKLLDERVGTLERYLGASNEDDINDNIKHLLEFNDNVDRKYEFSKIAELYRQIKPLMDNPQDYRTQMFEMKKKVDLIDKSRDDILEYHKLLAELKEIRGSLDFKPVFNVNQKMKDLNKINKDHLKQCSEVNETKSETNELVENYNDLIEMISQKFAKMDMKLSELEQKKQ